MKKVTAGFWIRFLAGVIDSFFFLVLAYLLSIAVVSKDASVIPWAYYSWVIAMAIIIVIIQIIVPMLNSYKMTLGRWICRLEVQTRDGEKPSWKDITKKETIYSLLWILCFFCFVLFISPQLFEKMAKSNNIQIKNNPEFTSAEIFLISIPVSMITLSNFFQFVLTLSIIKKSHISFNDHFSNTKTVWKNKYYQLNKEQKIYSRPRVINQLEWID